MRTINECTNFMLEKVAELGNENVSAIEYWQVRSSIERNDYAAFLQRGSAVAMDGENSFALMTEPMRIIQFALSLGFFVGLIYGSQVENLTEDANDRV